MEWFKNLKIASKLQLLVVIATSFVILVSLVGFTSNIKLSKSLTDMYNSHLVAVSDIQEVNGNLSRIMADTLNLFQNTSNAETNALIEDINSLKTQNTDLLKEYSSTNLSKDELELFGKMKQLRETFWKNIFRSVELGKQNKNAQAYAVYKSNLKFLQEYREILAGLVKCQKDISKKVFDENVVASKASTTLTVLIGVFSLILLITLGNVISSMISKPISRAIEELESGAEEVSAASQQLSAASEQLASGTSEQAAAIQETSSAIDETDSMVRQNADNTQQAAVLAKNAKNAAEKSSKEMDNMIISMENLKKSSDEIAKIIKVIDEIAFQTNILALNAAVEAARAGDAGKGFAVVAEEVRNLAQKSAIATRDTSKIIENNIILSKENVGMTQTVNENIKQIDIETQKVSEILNEIAIASQEQAQGIQQINKAIQQMEQVLQTNASTAEESSSAAHELSSQAVSVKDIVNNLIAMAEGQDALRNRKHHNISKPILKSPAKVSTETNKKATSSLKIPKKPQTTNLPENVIPLDDDF